MEYPTPNAPPLPTHLCGYPIDRLLSPIDAEGVPPSFLAIGPGGRGIVLKGLDAECLLKKGNLHPSIRDRLGRVRELALAGVANLHGVERDAEHPHHGYEAWLVWEYVRGQTFDEYAAVPGRTPRDLAMVAREIVLLVESMHVQGIVHGSIKGGNVFVDPSGAVRLTHVSPLLYTDPGEDALCVVEMLQEAIRRRGEEDTPLGRVVAEAAQMTAATSESERIDPAHPPAALRHLAARLGVLVETKDRPVTEAAASNGAAAPDTRPRRRSLFGAAAAALVGVALAYGIWQAVGHWGQPAPPRAVHDTRPK